jgi:hypothetical protein
VLNDAAVKHCYGIVALVAGLFFACFVSVATIISAWNGPHRIAAAWVICSAWGFLALVGLRIARRALVSVPPTFHLVGTALARDYAHFVDSLSIDSGR